MGTVSLVTDQLEGGQKLIEELVCDGFDVTVAFWVSFKFDEDGPMFYIVSRTVDEQGLHAAYLAVRAVLPKIPAPWGPWTSVSEIRELRLVGLNDPLARDVLALGDRYPGRNRFRGASIRGESVEELYIYPR